MSTSYRAFGKTLQDAIDAGWSVVKQEGELLVLSDGSNYAADVYQNTLKGEPVLEFERYASNDVSDLVEALDAISEHDEGFWTEEEEAEALAEDDDEDEPPMERGSLLGLPIR